MQRSGQRHRPLAGFTLRLEMALPEVPSPEPLVGRSPPGAAQRSEWRSTSEQRRGAPVPLRVSFEGARQTLSTRHSRSRCQGGFSSACWCRRLGSDLRPATRLAPHAPLLQARVVLQPTDRLEHLSLPGFQAVGLSDLLTG